MNRFLLLLYIIVNTLSPCFASRCEIFDERENSSPLAYNDQDYNDFKQGVHDLQKRLKENLSVPISERIHEIFESSDHTNKSIYNIQTIKLDDNQYYTLPQFLLKQLIQHIKQRMSTLEKLIHYLKSDIHTLEYLISSQYNDTWKIDTIITFSDKNSYSFNLNNDLTVEQQSQQIINFILKQYNKNSISDLKILYRQYSHLYQQSCEGLDDLYISEKAVDVYQPQLNLSEVINFFKHHSNQRLDTSNSSSKKRVKRLFHNYQTNPPTVS